MGLELSRVSCGSLLVTRFGAHDRHKLSRVHMAVDRNWDMLAFSQNEQNRLPHVVNLPW